MATVLIVEDDRANTLVFRKILTKRGKLDVLHTEDVNEILQLAQAQAVDLILMDVSLSNSAHEGQPVDGVKITQLLKSSSETQRVPVVLVTAHAMQGDRENLLKQSGADAYISKPVVDQQKFVDTIQQLIQTQ
ncbi:MAG: response regulator [Cyanobacteria bacterium P01_H01_bin.121]